MKKKIITSLLVATAVYYFNPDDDSIENMNCLA